jgi:hypothetical protein
MRDCGTPAPALAIAPRGVDNAEVEVRDLSVYEQLLESKIAAVGR